MSDRDALAEANAKLAAVEDRLRQDGDGSGAYSELHRDLFNILASEPEVLAVVDRQIKIGCDPYDERGVVYVDGVELDDVGGFKSSRVIVIGSGEKEV